MNEHKHKMVKIGNSKADLFGKNSSKEANTFTKVYCDVTDYTGYLRLYDAGGDADSGCLGPTSDGQWPSKTTASVDGELGQTIRR